MRPNRADIKPHHALEVLTQFGLPGWQPGSFVQALIIAMRHADPINRAKLAQAYPGYMAAVALAMDEPDGLTELQVIAASPAGE